MHQTTQAMATWLLIITLAGCNGASPASQTAKSSLSPAGPTGEQRTTRPDKPLAHQLTDQELVLTSNPAQATVLSVYYVIVRKDNPDDFIHITSYDATFGFPVRLKRGRLYGGLYLIKAYADDSKVAFAELETIIPAAL